ncbi:MAG: DUF3972 domain-containing protein [Anaerolineae bacterium]|nr:DUF3972 domain-containing protein [Anaerolineae bacterium]
MTANESGAAYYRETFAGEAAAAEPLMVYAYDTATSSQNTAPATIPQNQLIERLIIRNGSLSVVVQDTEETIQQISQLVQRQQGWVVSSNIYDYSANAKAGTIYVRIPVNQFETTITAVKGMAVEVTSESTNSEDVTNQYVDLNARLSNLEATANRVRAFLDEAENVEEALAVNQELSRLEGEIEVLKGQIQYLSQSAAFSSLTINLTPDIVSQPVTLPGWRPQGTAKNALENLVAALQNIADFLIYFTISGLPLIILFGLPAYFIMRLIWRRWRGGRSITQPVSNKTS